MRPGSGTAVRFRDVYRTHRPQSSSFLGLPYRILNMNPKKGTTLGPMGSSVVRGLQARAFCRLGLEGVSVFRAEVANVRHQGF